MTYEHPIPEGMTELDAAAVETEAVLQLVLLLFNAWPDDKLQAAIDRLRSDRIGVPTPHVAESEVVERRGSERAAQILHGVLGIREDLHMLRNPIDI